MHLGRNSLNLVNVLYLTYLSNFNNTDNEMCNTEYVQNIIIFSSYLYHLPTTPKSRMQKSAF